MSCVPEAGLAAYLFKHNPDAGAAHWNRPSIAAAVAWTRGDSRRALLGPARGGAAVQRLMTSDVSRVSRTAEFLRVHGSSAVKSALLDRLRTWSEQWRGRAPELDALRRDPTGSPARVESAIVFALFNATQIVLTQNDAGTIRVLCVTDDCRRTVDAWPPPTR